MIRTLGAIALSAVAPVTLPGAVTKAEIARLEEELRHPKALAAGLPE